MGMQVEFNWFIIAKKKDDFTPMDGLNRVTLYKSGQRIYPVGKDYTLPVLAEGKVIGLGSVTKMEMEEDWTRIEIEMVYIFEENDPIAAYYEESYAAYKNKQEELNHGGRVNLRSAFIERLHGGSDL